MVTRSTWTVPQVAPDKVHRKFFDLKKKWQFSGVSRYTLHNAPEFISANISHFEALFDPEHAYEAVSTIYDQDGETYLDAVTLGDPRRLFLEVDLQYPRNVLIAMIEAEVRKAQEERQVIRQGELKRRRRLDKVDSYLKVYDLAEGGETFTRIARAVGKPASSVKSVFVAARRNIFVEIPASAGMPPTEAPSKRATPSAEFADARNLDSHMARCPQCQKAERFEDMCPQARAFAEQDYGSQRELTVGRDPIPLSEEDPPKTSSPPLSRPIP